MTAINVGAVFSELATAAKGDGKAMLPYIIQAAETMAANPTRAGVILAGIQLLEGAAPILLPQITQDLGGIINTEIQNLISDAAKRATAAAAPPPAKPA